MKNSFLGSKYAALHFGYWMDYLIVANFAAVFLIGRGFNSVQIGYVTTAAALIGLILQPITADIADRSKVISVNHILLLLLGGSFLLALILTLNKGFLVTFLLFMIIYSFIATISPLLSALCLKYEDQGFPLNFGIARSCGSFGYAICAYIMGNVTEKMGSETILPVFCVITLLMVITLICMPGTSNNAGKSENFEDTLVKENGQMIRFLMENKKYSLFLLGSMFSFFSQFLFATYMIYFANAYGGGDSVMGTVLFVTAFAEIPAVAFGMKIMNKLSAETMLRIFSIAAVIKYTSLIFVTNINGFILIHCIHFFYSAFYIIASVYFADKLVDKKDAVKAQAFMGVATTGITGMLANVFGGYMIKYLEIKTILVICSFIAVIGVALMFTATVKKKESSTQ